MNRLCGTSDRYDTVEEFWNRSHLENALLAASGADERIIRQFELDFASRLDPNRIALFVASGRDAAQLALQTLEPRPGNWVLLPDFTCPVVGDAILEAGFQIGLFDFSPTAGWPHWQRLEPALRSGKVSAVIVPHLFGLPCDIRPLMELARRYHVPVVEDCAHCLGGRIAGRPAGTWGDFSIFSFNYDKPISLGGGGMLVIDPSTLNENMLDALKDRASRGRLPVEAEKKVLDEFVRWLCDRRQHIGAEPGGTLFQALKQKAKKVLTRLSPGKTGPVRSPWLSGVGVLRAALGIQLLQEYPSVMEVRNRNYQVVEDFIAAHPFGELLDSHSDVVSPAWIKAKLKVQDRSQAETDALGRHMQSMGFRVGRFNWPYTLSQKFPEAVKADSAADGNESRRVADLSLDIPIHQNLGEAEIDAMMQGMLKWLQK